MLKDTGLKYDDIITIEKLNVVPLVINANVDIINVNVNPNANANINRHREHDQY